MNSVMEMGDNILLKNGVRKREQKKENIHGR
jgi:hypothetical protein